MQQMECPDEVLERLVMEYSNRMYKTCCQYLKNADLAQDAMQDAFLKIYKGWPSIQIKQAEKAWVMRVTVNVCKDYLRCAWKRHVILMEEYPEWPDEDKTVRTEERDALKSAVRQLPLKDQQVVYLRYYMGFQVKEIAEALHTPQTTISVRLKRAKDKLRVNMQYPC